MNLRLLASVLVATAGGVVIGLRLDAVMAWAGAIGWALLVAAAATAVGGRRLRGSIPERPAPAAHHQDSTWHAELVDSLGQPALLFSRDGRLHASNVRARELLGMPFDTIGATVLQAVGSTVVADAVRDVRAHGTPLTVDVELADHDLQLVVSLVGDETLVIVSDRTQERRVEELRRNFVVNASHELKTPVTSIQTLAEALAVTIRSDPDRSSALVHRLGDEAERLARLVYDLLDLRRLEEGGQVDRGRVDLAEVIRMVVAQLVPRAEARQVGIAVTAPDRLAVSGIPGDLEVIVKNLVGNALQYNQPGGSVEVILEESAGWCVLRVVDTGIGIPQQDLGRIFERFYRVDTARSRETGGTGLGLSLVRHAVERHGGQIRVDSLLGEGTTFTVTLPSGVAA